MITIRKASNEDAATVAEIGKVSFVESHGSSAAAEDIEYYVSWAYAEDTVRAQLEDADNIFHLVFYDGRIAGYSKMRFNAANEHVNETNVSTLDRLYLLREFYDAGLGRKLFEHNVALSREANQKGMWLYTWVENRRAIMFYEKMGFKIVGDALFKISSKHSNPNYVMYLGY